MRVVCVLLGACPLIPHCEPDDVLEARGARSGGPARDGTRPTQVNMRSQPQGAPLQSFVGEPNTEDGLQLSLHLVHLVGGGHMQCVKKHSCHGHIPAGPSKVWMRHPVMVHGGGDGPGPSLGLGEVNGCGSLCP
jgi:hypothetical protein